MFRDGSFKVLFNLDGGGTDGSGSFLDNATAEQDKGQEPKVETQQGANTVQSEPEVAKGGEWRAQLPKDLRDNENLKSFKTIGELANAYLGKNTEDKKGETSNSFIQFEEQSKEWEDFKDKLAVDPTGIVSAELVEVAKKNGVSASQLKEVMKGLNEANEKSIDKLRSQASAMCENTLKQVWGDKYDGNVEDMKRGFKKIVGEDKEFFMSLSNAGLNNSPIVCELLRRVGTFFNAPKPQTGRVEHTAEEVNPYGIPSQFYKKG